MFQKVQKYMMELNMVSPEDRLLVGVSGGADSVCLLLLLHELQKEMDFSLEVVHVEHGIRGEESLKDADFVAALCKRLQIVCHMVSVNVPEYSKEKGVGLEEGARLLRYEAFAKLAKAKQAKVVLAHHIEDNAETVLFQMARGSALAGLCGMSPVRIDETDVCYIRPLLDVHRSEIEAFLKEQGQKFCVDSTNAELEYSRNYLRNVILKDMAHINVQAVSHIHESASQLMEIKDFLEQEVEKNWAFVVTEEEQALRLDIDKLQRLHLALQKEIVHRAIAKVAGSKKDIGQIHVKDVLALCKNQSGKEIHLPYDICAKKEYDVIRLEKKEAHEKKQEIYWVDNEQLEACNKTNQPLCISVGDKGESFQIRVFSNSLENGQIQKNPYTKWLDYDKIKQGFCIRNRNVGDYFICDEFGHHKKLKQYMIDEKIPATKRGDMWLLAQEAQVIWLVEGRISEHVKVTEHTKTIIEIRYQGGR